MQVSTYIQIYVDYKRNVNYPNKLNKLIFQIQNGMFNMLYIAITGNHVFCIHYSKLEWN